MAATELATNALKYGALSTAEGIVDIGWKTGVREADTLELVWRESGGPSVSPPTKKGYGSRLLERSVSGDFGGTSTIEFLPGGLQCTILAPLMNAQELP